MTVVEAKARLEALGLPAEFVGSGRYRMVFRVSETEVVKVPINEAGCIANLREALTFEREGRGGHIPYAQCRLEGGLLWMEYVEVKHIPYSTGPEWVYSVDCGQVGRAQDGCLVAFDYGG
jgi:hypothetical protein